METVKNVAQQAVNALTGTGKTVLVTGANGFVAAHVLNAFLEKGYHVRGTVRSEESAERVRQTHANYNDQLSFVIVKDITQPGAFDEAVKDVDGVIHTASPFVMNVEDNERDLLEPAIKGTNGILESVQKNNPKVKRVVITSSFAAILNMEKGRWPEHTYTEADWNPVTYEAAKAGPAPVAYCASKTFAERAAFEFVEKNKPNFTISTICPPMVYGPNAHYVSSLDKLNTSSAEIWGLMNGSKTEVPNTEFFAFVDARDVGEAHRRAYESASGAQQRYFCTGGTFTYQQICDILRAEFPQLQDRVPKGNPGEPMPAVYKVDNSKARKELGINFRSLKECIVDTGKNLLELEKKLGQA